MPLELIYPDRSDNKGRKWRACVLCGATYIRVHLPFDSGSVEPTDDETLTGATSGDTGVVEKVTLESGTWAGGDAKGWVTLSSPTGITFTTGLAFQDNETVNGSTGGSNMLTVNGDGQMKRYGRLYPDTHVVYVDGKWFCLPHYRYRYKHKLEDEVKLNIDEYDRESEKI